MLLASVLSLLAVSSASAAWPSDGSYLVGSSFRADMQRLDVLQALGSTHARLYAHFAYVVPTLSDVDPTLTVATVDANFAQYSSWLNEQADWKMMDKSEQQHGHSRGELCFNPRAHCISLSCFSFLAQLHHHIHELKRHHPDHRAGRRHDTSASEVQRDRVQAETRSRIGEGDNGGRS